jgi:hypothetical protein
VLLAWLNSRGCPCLQYEDCLHASSQPHTSRSSVVLLCSAQAIAEVGDPQADDYVKSTFLHPQVSPLDLLESLMVTMKRSFFVLGCQVAPVGLLSLLFVCCGWIPQAHDRGRLVPISLWSIDISTRWDACHSSVGHVLITRYILQAQSLEQVTTV